MKKRTTGMLISNPILRYGTDVVPVSDTVLSLASPVTSSTGEGTDSQHSTLSLDNCPFLLPPSLYEMEMRLDLR